MSIIYAPIKFGMFYTAKTAPPASRNVEIIHRNTLFAFKNQKKIQKQADFLGNKNQNRTS